MSKFFPVVSKQGTAQLSGHRPVADVEQGTKAVPKSVGYMRHTHSTLIKQKGKNRDQHASGTVKVLPTPPTADPWANNLDPNTYATPALRHRVRMAKADVGGRRHCPGHASPLVRSLSCDGSPPTLDDQTRVRPLKRTVSHVLPESNTSSSGSTLEDRNIPANLNRSDRAPSSEPEPGSVNVSVRVSYTGNAQAPVQILVCTEESMNNASASREVELDDVQLVEEHQPSLRGGAPPQVADCTPHGRDVGPVVVIPYPVELRTGFVADGETFFVDEPEVADARFPETRPPLRYIQTGRPMPALVENERGVASVKHSSVKQIRRKNGNKLLSMLRCVGKVPRE